MLSVARVTAALVAMVAVAVGYLVAVNFFAGSIIDWIGK